VGLERPQQVAGLAQPGQHERPALRQRGMELLGGREAVDSGEVDVQDRDVGQHPQGRRDDLVTPLQLGDDLHVGLEGQQRDQRTADQVHVLGDQHADH
jgi:hypothetical protein